jgi:hypothetical protein
MTHATAHSSSVKLAKYRASSIEHKPDVWAGVLSNRGIKERLGRHRIAPHRPNGLTSRVRDYR